MNTELFLMLWGIFFMAFAGTEVTRLPSEEEKAANRVLSYLGLGLEVAATIIHFS